MTCLKPLNTIQTICLTAFFAWSGSVNADVRIPGFYTDHMVIQQKAPVRLRGWAHPGEKVTVKLGNATSTVTTSADGNWSVELPARNASSDPVSLIFTGKNTITVRDVLVGEVWLCSGQSNMEWTVASSNNAAEEIATANFPLIRHVKISRKPSNIPLDDVKAEWQVCSPETAGRFTACGYFMARKLFQELDVPIGLVNSSWGGTQIEPWTPLEGFAVVPQLADIYASVIGRTPGTEQYKDAMGKFLQATETWLVSATESMEARQSVSPNPKFPNSLVPFKSHQDPTMLYNGMIHSLVGFPIRGAIWYQGESNRGDGMMYFEKKKALIAGWRELWKQGDFPFYFVQIAPFQYGQDSPEVLARFWEAQEAVLQLPKTGMVVTNDIAKLNNIHPPNKQDVGLRLANLALKNDYGKTDVIAESPQVSNLQIVPRKLILEFKNTGGGLKTSDGNPATHFEIIGPKSDGFQTAIAVIEGDKVILKSKSVEYPTAFRFAWHKLAEPNLRGGTGLPVGAVRGGTEPSFTDNLPINDEYSMVYDLDLSKLGKSPQYDVDHTASVGKFDRVAYLLEIEKPGEEPQAIFVSADAWTDDPTKLGVPTVDSKAIWQTGVKNITVQSNVKSIQTGRNMEGGLIEFWPNNYGTINAARVPGASDAVYDYGDSMKEPYDGYGSMQIHNRVAEQTLFAVNHWALGDGADIGIGNSTGSTRDWTFTGNAARYSKKRLRVFVRPIEE